MASGLEYRTVKMYGVWEVDRIALHGLNHPESPGVDLRDLEDVMSISRPNTSLSTRQGIWTLSLPCTSSLLTAANVKKTAALGERAGSDRKNRTRRELVAWCTWPFQKREFQATSRREVVFKQTQPERKHPWPRIRVSEEFRFWASLGKTRTLQEGDPVAQRLIAQPCGSKSHGC